MTDDPQPKKVTLHIRIGGEDVEVIEFTVPVICPNCDKEVTPDGPLCPECFLPLE